MSKEYQKTYNSYSGADIVASITIPGVDSAKVLGELQTISYSIHREVTPVRTLGRINPVGFTRGARTIAGSLIFTVFDKNIAYDLLDYIRRGAQDGTFTAYSSANKFIIMDEMPPFDVTITMKNEYGQDASMRIKGIVIVDEGQVMSIEDILTENTMSFMASDIEVLDNKMSDFRWLK